MIDNTFTLSEKKQLWAFINIFYATPFTEVYKRNTTKVPVIDFEIKKIWRDRSLSLKINSLLGNKTKSTVLNSDVSPYLKNSFNQNVESRVFQLRVSFSFGNSKTKKNKQSQLANDETSNRVQ